MMNKEKVEQKIKEIEEELSIQEIMYLFDILAKWVPFSQLQSNYMREWNKFAKNLLKKIKTKYIKIE